MTLQMIRNARPEASSNNSIVGTEIQSLTAVADAVNSSSSQDGLSEEASPGMASPPSPVPARYRTQSDKGRPSGPLGAHATTSGPTGASSITAMSSGASIPKGQALKSSTQLGSEEGGILPLKTTPASKARRVHIQLPSLSADAGTNETQHSPSQISLPVPARYTQARSQYFSQGLESQRVPLEVIEAMGPQTDRSDILLSIHPDPVDRIVKGLKDHEFRNYQIPAQVSRVWIYVTRPIMELRYMAIIGPAKKPGEIDDEAGDGNAEFNTGTKSKFAHELLRVYQLNNSVPLGTLKENGWADSAPQRYCYLPPAAVGQLLANLRCALFEERLEVEADEVATVSQELQDQILSDIVHSTQMLSSDAAHGPDDVDTEVIPSTQGPAAENVGPSFQAPDISFARPSLPGPSRMQKTPVAARKVDFVPSSQATTASQSSTPTRSPEKSVPRPTEPIQFAITARIHG